MDQLPLVLEHPSSFTKQAPSLVNAKPYDRPGWEDEMDWPAVPQPPTTIIHLRSNITNQYAVIWGLYNNIGIIIALDLYIKICSESYCEVESFSLRPHIHIYMPSCRYISRLINYLFQQHKFHRKSLALNLSDTINCANLCASYTNKRKGALHKQNRNQS